MEERLQKYMARCGIASRRKCEEIILSGKIKVNDIIISELGTKVNSIKDKVEYEGKLILPEEKKVYIMLNKPEGYITSVKDEKNRQTVLDIINVQERIYPIGRLDYDSSGLIILTNDGEIYNKIIHPRVKIVKEYIALVKGEIKKVELEKLEKGIDIGGYITAPSKVELLNYVEKNSLIKIGIHEGKNRQIRRMCSVVNHEVISLKRIGIGKIKLGDLKKGEFRDLSIEELQYINSL
ncbi:rRNA pseudouridine synthase [Clostridium sp. SHJSY1]|uniref:pseudouridine synthase n=1 Tax=Clostridium sp. SHJSY1 TaxID=2942483 RepID=UPI002876B92F|nr:pseudouridine synthase [Clostridium sp. SHJSY1]MDS0524449.1 rRNA pseudouridine synthase [Clostridium sp. SHJSY1]